MTTKVRKLYLVPEDQMVAKMQVQSAPIEATGAAIQKMKMEDLLDTNQSNDQKQKLFADMMTNYRTLLNQMAQMQQKFQMQSAPVTEVPVDESANTEDVKTGFTMTGQDINKHFAKTYQKKAMTLIDQIGPKLQYTENGEFRGTKDVIEGSNVIELINYAVRPSNYAIHKDPPVGWKQFKTFLARQGVSTINAPGILRQSPAKIIPRKTQSGIPKKIQYGKGLKRIHQSKTLKNWISFPCFYK